MRTSYHTPPIREKECGFLSLKVFFSLELCFISTKSLRAWELRKWLLLQYSKVNQHEHVPESDFEMWTRQIHRAAAQASIYLHCNSGLDVKDSPAGYVGTLQSGRICIHTCGELCMKLYERCCRDYLLQVFKIHASLFSVRAIAVSLCSTLFTAAVTHSHTACLALFIIPLNNVCFLASGSSTFSVISCSKNINFPV